VYLDGTVLENGLGQRGALENRAQAGQITATYLYILDKVMREVPPGAEVMVVGFSQGGIHGQWLAESKLFNITDVVTFGSPHYSGAELDGGANIVRIRDSDDRIPPLGVANQLADGVEEVVDKVRTAWRSLLGDDVGAVQHEVERLNRVDLTFTTHTDLPGDPLFGSHTNPQTYVQGSAQYEYQASQSAAGRVALESQSRYTGHVVSDTDAGVRINFDNVGPDGNQGSGQTSIG